MAALGVVGIGSVGQAIAARLLARGHRVTIWSRRETSRTRALVDDGAIFSSAKASAFGLDVVVSCLSDDSAVCSVFTPDRIAGIGRGAVHINMSTISVALADELEAMHVAAGSLYLAAPVLGRPEAILSGDAQVVVAGTIAAIDAGRPILDELARSVWIVGDRGGRASLVKIAVNFNLLRAVQTLGASIALVERGGVDASEFIDILTASAYTGTVHQGYGSRIVQRRYKPAGFTPSNALKDLDLAIDASNALGLEMPHDDLRDVLLSSATQRPDLDWSALAEAYRTHPPK
ncbi:MAG: hypothetical protein QOE16_1604 [Microbacteriaceae bacterium]|jgi:3-hydroxyisobutyrate dehydrogenase-like beta-hydroxyacid dehydrogenase|nr:hypothetical protein [Microbacteriaceae bacterium]